MNDQAELDFSEKAEAPEVSEEDVQRLLAYLDGKNWVKGSVIQADLGWSERIVRAVSRASRPRVVSYPGSKGYKRWELCTVPEHDACLKAFRAQRDDMAESLAIFTRAYYQRYMSSAPRSA